MKINKSILILIVLFIGLQSQNLESQEQLYNLRALKEINLNKNTDAYPWLSNDGLRLYFCGYDPDTKRTELFISKRNSPDFPFKEPSLIINNTHGEDYLSPYLSADELRLCYIVRKGINYQLTQIHFASRKSIDDTFSDTKLINLKGTIHGELISPSFTEDLSQIFVFNLFRGKTSILQLLKTGPNEYSLSNRIILEHGNIKSGKLSTDGLSYFLSLEKKNELPSIHIMTRNSLSEPFRKMEVFKNSNINNEVFRNHQPYFTENRKFIVLTRSDANNWELNDLYIAQLNEREEIEEDLDISLFPNPTVDELYFQNRNNQAFDISILNSSGQLVMRERNFRQHNKIDISNLASGSYVVYLRTPDGQKRIKHIIQKLNL